MIKSLRCEQDSQRQASTRSMIRCYNWDDSLFLPLIQQQCVATRCTDRTTCECDTSIGVLLTVFRHVENYIRLTYTVSVDRNMPPRGGARVAKKIVVTSVNNPDDVRFYDSLAQAAKGTGLTNHSYVSAAIAKKKELNGFKFAYHDEPTAEQQVPQQPTTTTTTTEPEQQQQQVIEYTFFEEVDALFRGQKVRYTDGADGNRMVSVLDVIRVMQGTNNPSVPWLRLQEQYTEVVTKCKVERFSGTARETPVADVATIIEIINVLPGKRAARFRQAGARVLVRVLGGDPSLVHDLAENAERVAAIRAEGTNNPLNMFQLPAGTSVNARRSIMFSPSIQAVDRPSLTCAYICF